MADPQTGQIGIYVPTRGSDVGTWDLPVNANSSAIDSLFANVATISLSNINVTLTTPPNSGAAWSGPYQSQSGILKFTGTLTGNCVVTLPRAGFFIIDNQCVVGAFYAQIGSAAPGKLIGAPPGAPCHVYCDGTDVSYVNLGAVGAALDLQGVTVLPAWMTACTRSPYLVKDGSIYNIADFPALGRLLGSTFGGNGSTTFGVPDERNRMRLPIDLNVGGFSNRVTNAISGIDGKTMNASGGSESMQQHNHPAVVADPGHFHVTSGPLQGNQNMVPGGGSLGGFASSFASDTRTTGITVTTNNTGAGASQNMVPTIVSFLPLIKT